MAPGEAPSCTTSLGSEERKRTTAVSSSKPAKPFWRWHPDKSRPHLRDDDPVWLSRRKHFFILSDAGKPVYSRYGEAGNLSGFTAALSAIIAGFEENLSGSRDDAGTSSDSDGQMTSGSVTLKVNQNQLQVVWIRKNGLVYAATSTVGESLGVLKRQLNTLRNLLLFVLTNAVERALLKSAKFDARKLLGSETGGADAAFDKLCHAATWCPGSALGCWAPLPFSVTKRKALRLALRSVCLGAFSRGTNGSTSLSGGGIFAALLATEHHVVAVSASSGGRVGSSSFSTGSSSANRETQKNTLQKNTLHASDVYLLTHFVRAVAGFKSNPESFAPVCLSHRNAKAFAHAYISYLRPDSGIFLVLLAEQNSDSDTFNAMSHAKTTLLDLWTLNGTLDAIEKRTRKDLRLNTPCASPRIGEEGTSAVRCAGRPLQTAGVAFRESPSQEAGTRQASVNGDTSQSRSTTDTPQIPPQLPAGLHRLELHCSTQELPLEEPRPGQCAPGSVRLETEVPPAAGGGFGDRVVQHFLYVRPNLGQYVCPEWCSPLCGRDSQKLLLRAYRRVIDAVSGCAGAGDGDDEDGRSSNSSNSDASASGTSKHGNGGWGGGGFSGVASFFQSMGNGPPGNKIDDKVGSGGGGGRSSSGGDANRATENGSPRRRVHFESSAARVLLGFAGSDFELYVALAPGTSHTESVAACNRLCTWLRQEEPRLFA